MAWLDETTEVEVDLRQFWQLEWASYGEDFIAEYGAVTGAADGDRVVRRLIVQEADLEWRGLTPAAADAQVATLVQGDASFSYQAARKRLLPSGGANVYAKKRVYDPAGWSAWMLESELGTIPAGA